MVGVVLSDDDFCEDEEQDLSYWLSKFQKKNQNLSYQLPSSSRSLWIFWSHSYSNSVADNSSSNLVKSGLQRLVFEYCDSPVLIQFWAPVSIGGRCFLTTCDRPFAVTQLDILDYRKYSLDYKFIVDGHGDGESEKDLGLLGRVFRQKTPEFTPCVEYYSSKEYLQREHALWCRIKVSFALPVFEPSGQCCAGVLELVGATRSRIFTIEEVRTPLEEVGLKALGTCDHFFEDKEVVSSTTVVEMHVKSGGQNALNEIRKVLEVVCETHKLPLAQTWVLCSHFSAEAYGSSFNVRCSGEVLSPLPNLYYSADIDATSFRLRTEGLHLQKGKGAVGRAYMFHNSCFCGDVTQFTITDYPFAHYARYYELTSCFAICLRSDYTGDCDYVLEFFLRQNNTVGVGNPRILLNLLLATMKQHFRSFKVASGKELGEELYVQIVDFDSRLVFDSFQIPMHEPLQNVGDMMQPHSSNQQLMVEADDFDFRLVFDSLQNVGDVMQPHSSNQQLMVEDDDDAIQNERNVVSAEQIETAVSYSERKRRTTEISISYEDIKQHFGRKLAAAAESLGVSRSTLKRICRQHKIGRWPSHKKNKNNHSLLKRNPQCSNLTADQAIATAAHATIQDVRTVTIKAEYRGKKVKFELSCSSGMLELEQKVSKRLKLNVGTFTIEYLDTDDDWILITCDEDLKDCINSRSLSITTIRMLVQPITN